MSFLAPRVLRASSALKLSAIVCASAFALTPALAKPKNDPPVQSQPATVECEDSLALTSNDYYAGACVGPLQGSINQVVSVTLGNESFDLFGSSQGDDGLVDAPNGKASGILHLSEELFGRFVIGLRSGNSYSLYLFDADDEGLDEIAFDIQGVSVGTGDKLAQAFVFAPPGTQRQDGGEPAAAQTPDTETAVPVQNVPEPASGALVLLALGAAGLALRRRRG